MTVTTVLKATRENSRLYVFTSAIEATSGRMIQVLPEY